MKVRKLLAGILSAAMVLGTMVVPVSASTEPATSLPTAVNGVITLTEDVKWTVKDTEYIENDVDLNGHKLTLTTDNNTVGIVGISGDITIKGGDLEITDFYSTTGVVNVQDNSSLTLTNVNATATNVNPSTGIFSIHGASAKKITLNNTNVTTSNLHNVRGVFYMGSNEYTGSVEINGGTFNIENNGDINHEKGAYDDGGAMFYIIPAKLNGVTITSSCGRPTFRNVMSCEITDSKIEATQVRSEDAVFVTNPGDKIPTQTITFKNSEITTSATTKLFEGNIATDANTTYNEGKLSAVEGVTLKEADKLPDAVDGVITLTENVTLKSKTTNIQNKSVIDLNGYTLTLTGTQSIIVVWNDTTFKNGKINVSDLTTGDGVFFVQSGTLTFDDVDITVDGMYPPKDANGAYEKTTGVFRNLGSGAKIVLNNTDVVTDNLYDAYLFYDELAQNDTSFEINGGSITMNGKAEADKEDNYSKSIFFGVKNAVVNGVKIKADCGRAFVRASSRTDSNILFINSDIEANILRPTKDTVNEGLKLTFINSKFKTNDGATLKTAAGIIVSDKNTTYNSGKLSNAEGVTTLDNAAVVGGVVYDSLKAAVAAAKSGDTIYIVGNVSAKDVSFAADKDLTFDGNGTIDFSEQASWTAAANLTFRNITLNWGNGRDYHGIQHCKNMLYENCTIKGKVFLYGQNEIFNKCKFVQDVQDYNVWTYGAMNTEFKDCTFEGKGKAVLIYNEFYNGKTAAEYENATAPTVTVNNCTFTASEKADGKAAIEIDSSLCPFVLDVKGETTAEGFDNGSMSNDTLYNVKKMRTDLSDNSKDKTTVTIKGTAIDLEPVREQLTEKTVWATMTDSGKYDDNKGVIRFSFKVNPTKSFGAITKAGIKFVNTENTEIGEETSVGVEQSGADSGVFYADITGITGSGKYFARAYISNGTATEWSDMVEATVDWNRTFTDYTAE